MGAESTNQTTGSLVGYSICAHTRTLTHAHSHLRKCLLCFILYVHVGVLVVLQCICLWSPVNKLFITAPSSGSRHTVFSFCVFCYLQTLNRFMLFFIKSTDDEEQWVQVVVWQTPLGHQSLETTVHVDAATALKYNY